MQVTFNDSEMEASKFLGEGTHSAFVSKMEMKLSKGGSRMMETEFSTIDGRTCRDWFVLEGAGKFKLALLAQAVGFTKEQLKSGAFSTEMLQGKGVTLHRKITGKNSDGKNLYENDYAIQSGGDAKASSDDMPF